MPTPEDFESLPRVCDKIPHTIFFVVVAEVAERFTYRSLTGPMRKHKKQFNLIVRLILNFCQKTIFRTRFMGPPILELLERYGHYD